MWSQRQIVLRYMSMQIILGWPHNSNSLSIELSKQSYGLCRYLKYIPTMLTNDNTLHYIPLHPMIPHAQRQPTQSFSRRSRASLLLISTTTVGSSTASLIIPAARSAAESSSIHVLQRLRFCRRRPSGGIAPRRSSSTSIHCPMQCCSEFLIYSARSLGSLQYDVVVVSQLDRVQ